MVKNKEDGGIGKKTLIAIYKHSLLYTSTHYKLKYDKACQFCDQYILHR